MPKESLVWKAAVGGAIKNAFSAQLGNITYHAGSSIYGYPAYVEVRGPRGGVKHLDLGNYAKLEQAKQACERRYAVVSSKARELPATSPPCIPSDQELERKAGHAPQSERTEIPNVSAPHGSLYRSMGSGDTCFPNRCGRDHSRREGGQHDARESEQMWKVGDVEPVSVIGAEGYPYGFNITDDKGKPLVSFAYATRAEAEAAAALILEAIESAVEVRPHA